MIDAIVGEKHQQWRKNFKLSTKPLLFLPFVTHWLSFI